MARYLLVVITLVGGLLLLFLVASALGISLLTDPTPHLGAGGAGSAAIGVGLLVVDVLLPVPSNLVMVMHGTLFGVLLGTLLSLIGSVAAAALAFWLGRRGSPWLSRFVTERERARADRLFERWGGYAIALTRPLPIVAETVALLAGTSPMRWPTLLRMATLGSLPPALLYALAGAAVVDLRSAFVIFGSVIVLTVVAWWWTQSRSPANNVKPTSSGRRPRAGSGR